MLVSMLKLKVIPSLKVIFPKFRCWKVNSILLFVIWFVSDLCCRSVIVSLVLSNNNTDYHDILEKMLKVKVAFNSNKPKQHMYVV